MSDNYSRKCPALNLLLTCKNENDQKITHVLVGFQSLPKTSLFCKPKSGSAGRTQRVLRGKRTEGERLSKMNEHLPSAGYLPGDVQGALYLFSHLAHWKINRKTEIVSKVKKPPILKNDEM